MRTQDRQDGLVRQHRYLEERDLLDEGIGYLGASLLPSSSEDTTFDLATPSSGYERVHNGYGTADDKCWNCSLSYFGQWYAQRSGANQEQQPKDNSTPSCE